MKQLLNRIKNNLIRIFNYVVNSTKKLLITIKNDKKMCLTTLFLSILTLLISSSTLSLGAILGAHLPTSKTQSVVDYLYNSDSPIGLIYQKETSSNNYTLSSVQPELSQKIRFTYDYSTFELYDCYLSDFQNSTPAIVDYIDKKQVGISFLLLPKENYTNSFFNGNYKFKLLSGGTSPKSNTEDLYINKNYADKLLVDNNLSSYKDLLDMRINLPYSNQYVKNVEMSYVVKGVLDDTDSKYQYYQSCIGDFFLANQYLSLPINGNVVFKTPTKYSDFKKLINTMFDWYNYDTVGRHFDALNFAYHYSYRIVTISDLNNDNNYKNIYDENNAFYKNIDKLYNYYFEKQYIVPTILIIVGNVAFLVLFYELIKLLVGGNKKLNILPIILAILSIPMSMGLNSIYVKLINKSLPLSITSWQSFIFMLVELVLLLTLVVINKIVARKRICNVLNRAD